MKIAYVVITIVNITSLMLETYTNMFDLLKEQKKRKKFSKRSWSTLGIFEQLYAWVCCEANDFDILFPKTHLN